MKTVNIPDPVMSNTIAFQGLLERSLRLQKRIEDGITEKNNNLQNQIKLFNSYPDNDLDAAF
jgi:hypothetical protein